MIAGVSIFSSSEFNVFPHKVGKEPFNMQFNLEKLLKMLSLSGLCDAAVHVKK